jgi:hypothetical protein
MWVTTWYSKAEMPPSSRNYSKGEITPGNVSPNVDFVFRYNYEQIKNSLWTIDRLIPIDVTLFYIPIWYLKSSIPIKRCLLFVQGGVSVNGSG